MSKFFLTYYYINWYMDFKLEARRPIIEHETCWTDCSINQQVVPTFSTLHATLSKNQLGEYRERARA